MSWLSNLFGARAPSRDPFATQPDGVHPFADQPLTDLSPAHQTPTHYADQTVSWAQRKDDPGQIVLGTGNPRSSDGSVSNRYDAPIQQEEDKKRQQVSDQWSGSGMVALSGMCYSTGLYSYGITGAITAPQLHDSYWGGGSNHKGRGNPY